MKLFFDESVGRRVPAALGHIAAPCEEVLCPTRNGPVLLGSSDEGWLEFVGTNGYLAVTHNVAILDVPRERQALIDHRAGVVFVDAGQAARWLVLRLMLNRWEWLDTIDKSVSRPFGFRATLGNRATRVL